jgi:hypothetical protein
MKMLFGIVAPPGKIKKLDCDPSKLEDLLSEIGGGFVQFVAASDEEYATKKEQHEKFFGITWI